VRRGFFLVIEGIDGAGKGAQARMLHAWLMERGVDAVLTSEPTSGWIGSLIRRYLHEPEVDQLTLALLFAADRREHVLWIESQLEEGRVVISDRYVQSSLAYQGAGGVDRRWIERINSFAPEPDLLILLDLDPQVALERVAGSRSRLESFEDLEFLRRVREAYLSLSPGLVIDASKTLDEVQGDIRRAVSEALRLG